MNQTASTYADNGLYVFPLLPKLKIPFKGSRGLLDAINDPVVVETTFPSDANIGCNAGLSGLVVLDVDLENKNTNPKPNQWLNSLTPRQLDDLNKGNHLKTPSGGDQFVFRCEINEFKSSASAVAPFVDIRCKGGYFLLPPSFTEAGSYAWDGMTEKFGPSWGNELATIPSWLRELLIEKSKPQPKATIITGERIREGVTNTTLTSRAGVMRHAGLGEAEIYQAIKALNESICDTPLTDKQLKSIAKSVSKYEPDAVLACMAGVDDGKVDISAIIGGKQESSTTSEVDISAIVALPEQETDFSEDPSVDRTSETKTFMKTTIPPGLIQEMVDGMLASAPYPNRNLALGGALVAMSGVVGRNFALPMGGRMNLELVVLAGTGTGKDHPRKYLTNLFHAIEADNLLAGDYASKEGLEDRLLENPTAISLKDEADGIMAALKNHLDQNAKKIWDYRLELFSSSANIIRTRMKVGKPSQSIYYPFLTVMSSAIPKSFFESLTEHALTKGLIPRSTILLAGERGGAERKPNKIHFSDRLKNELKAILNERPSGNLVTTGTAMFDPIQLNFTQDADDFFWEFRLYCDAKVAELGKAHRQSEVMWTRCAELAIKYAGLYAISKHGASCREIDLEAIQWGCDFSKQSIKNVQVQIDGIGDSADKDQKAMSRLLKLIKAEPDGGISHSDLLRKSGMGSKIFGEYIKTLIETGEIHQGLQETKRGKSRVTYGV